MTTFTTPFEMIDRAGVGHDLPRSLRNHAVFLDVDGSLIDIAETPESVIVPPGLPGDLARARDAASGAFALVSGRSIESLDRLFAPTMLSVIGLHGGEIRRPDGSVTSLPIPAVFETLRPRLQDLVARHPGAQLEDKGRSIAVHYRRAPEAEAELEDAVEAMVEAAGGEISTQRGKKVIELKPTGTSKGVAVSDLMQIDPFPGRIPLAIGDDITDESMFSAVNALAGITIRVGQPDRPTEAKYRVDEPGNVRKWLASLP